MNTVSVKPNKKEQIQQRRALVLELYSQGMSQEKITEVLKPDVLKISQAVVSRDLKYLKENRIEYIKRNREQMTEEYISTVTNFKTLRRDVFEYYRKAKENNNVEQIIRLVPIIQSIEANIHDVVSTGDIIEAELIHFAKQQHKELTDKVEKIIV